MTGRQLQSEEPRHTVGASPQEPAVSITKTEPMSEEAYRQFALGDPRVSGSCTVGSCERNRG